MASPVQAAVEAASYDALIRSLNSVPGQLPGESIEEWLTRTEFERVVAETEAEGAGKASQLVYRWDYKALDKLFNEPPEFDRTVPEASAGDAWSSLDAPKSSQGAASQAPKVSASPQTAIKKAGAAGASAGGLLSVPLPTWVAAAAPLLGVAVGIGLYELSPEFWTKVSQTLLPWCYEDSQAMPVITDEEGNTYIDKEAVEALKRVFDEEGIGGGEIGKIGEARLDGKVCPYAYGSVSGTMPYTTIDVTFTADAFFYRTANSGVIVAISKTPFTLTVTSSIGSETLSSTDTTYRYNGQEKVFYVRGSNYNGPSVESSGLASGNVSSSQDAAITIFESGTEIPVYYPEGTSKWDGMTVDIGELPITEAYTDPAGSDTRDFIPAALPTTPGQSVDPETNPDPTKNEEPEKQISPYINPSINPNQYPSGSESTGEDDEELDKSAPIPLPYPPTQYQPDPDNNPSDPDDTPPQRFVDIIPPIDSGDITFSPVPTIGTPADGGVGGLVSVYNPTYSELQAFSNWLWVTYQDATIDKIWNNPFDGIISLYEIYVTPTEGARKYIKSGFLVSTVECATLPQRYIEINCGTAVFPEYYGNYLDYSPYSKALCYLPFIGVMELNVDDIVGHTVNITYRVDVYTGGCIAIITCAREGSNVALYQFSGNCSVQLPIAGGTQASIRAAQISAGAYQNAYHTAGLAGLAGGLASALFGGANFITGPVSGISQLASSSAFGQANATSQTVSAKSSVQHSGQFGESYGAMGHKKPYMIIKRPVQVIVPGYQQVYGFQAHKMVEIGSCTGFLRCRAVHVLSAQATDEEKSMIEQLLVSGVYVTEE